VSVLPDLQTLLTDRGVGPVTLGRRPASPDTILTLQTYQGDPNRLYAETGVPADERLAVQVVARARNQAEAEQLAARAFDALQFHARVINGRRYRHSRANQHPAYIGIDENDRALVSFNLTLRRYRTAGLDKEQ